MPVNAIMIHQFSKIVKKFTKTCSLDWAAIRGLAGFTLIFLTNWIKMKHNT